MLQSAGTKTPKFKKPPVVETVLGVQFSELAGFRTTHFGLFWDRIRSDFPKIDDQPRINRVVEVFPRKPLPRPARLSLSSAAGAQRVQYTDRKGSVMLQLQPDRFLYNWRRAEDGIPYGSFEKNVQRFDVEYERFREFCSKQNLDEPRPDLCEVCYVNHLLPVEGESAVELFEKALVGVRWELSGEFLPIPEATTFNRVFVIGDDVGRLYVEASIGFNRDIKKEFVHLKMTGRVNHRSQDNRDLLDSLRLAHDWVVNGFAGITESAIQKDRWERIS